MKSLIFYFRVCDATFFEHIFPLKNKLSKSIWDSNSNCLLEITLNLNLKNQQNFYLRRSKRKRTEKTFSADFFMYSVEDDPKTYAVYAEAGNSLEASFWKEVINSGMNFITSQ